MLTSVSGYRRNIVVSIEYDYEKDIEKKQLFDKANSYLIIYLAVTYSYWLINDSLQHFQVPHVHPLHPVDADTPFVRH